MYTLFIGVPQVLDAFGAFPQGKYYTLVDGTQDVACPWNELSPKRTPRASKSH